MGFSVIARIIAVLVAASGAAAAATANANSPMGSNLGFFRDWVSEYSTIDAFKMSRSLGNSLHTLQSVGLRHR